jgi:phage tail sheath protein FI
VIARVDANRGVWKAPAGLEANITGIAGLQYAVRKAENAQLNPAGVNCLRSLPGSGPTIWGGRTLASGNPAEAEYRHLAVRRLALWLEESLERGTRWAVFEANAEPLWLTSG